MNISQFFPLGIAKGEAFCNRIKERERLNQNIISSRHTMLMSPRRYGKSSVILYVLRETKFTYTEVDLFVAVNTKMIEEQIINGVKDIINKVSNKSEQIILIIKEYIKKLKSKWIIGTDGLNIELIPDKESDTTTNIMESLQLLENILKKKKIKACFFIDEFQEIGKLDESRGIEGAIRHVAQNTEYLTFIFSGSNRHILDNMFHDCSRPLYKLCDTIEIERIHQKHYIPFLNKIAKLTWKSELDENVIMSIFNRTELHPYYINALCSILWREKIPPKQQDVEKVWHDYILQEKSKTAKELTNLSTSQKRLLISIAKGDNKEITGKTSLRKLDLSSGAVIKALNYLERNDYIAKNSDGYYHVIDPLLKSSLILFYPDDSVADLFGSAKSQLLKKDGKRYTLDSRKQAIEQQVLEEDNKTKE